jgi:formylglycine-generating enzyme required for sulfatase activity
MRERMRRHERGDEDPSRDGDRGMKNRDLFVSHSTADRKTAEALVGDLEKGGLSCWLASRDVPMGGAYQAEIVDAIEHCRAMLLVFSDATNKSEHVLREIELAAQAKKPIYPLRIDRAEPAGGLKYMLANKQWVERKALGDRLVETIERLLAGGTVAQPREDLTPAASARSNRTPVAAGVGAVAACLVLAAGWFLVQGGMPGQPASAPSDQPAAKTGAPSVPDQPVTRSARAEADTHGAPASEPANVQAANVTEAARPGGGGASAPASAARPAPIVLAAAPTDTKALGDGVHLFKECEHCPVMAVVPAGRSLVGSPDYESGHNGSEGPQQQVVLRQPFAVGRSEVSFDEWLACVTEGGCNAYRPGDYGWGYGKQPVINVSWTDAKAYVEWLARKTGAPYRLLSESEWEYAARGCVSASCASKPFWFGTDISPARANYDWRYSYDGSPKAQPPRHTVATDASEPNPFGLLHVHGNVREWVEDCWNASLAGLPNDGSARTTGDCDSRVVRGGSWSDEPKDLRSATRSWEVMSERRAQIGFRVARSLAP